MYKNGQAVVSDAPLKGGWVYAKSSEGAFSHKEWKRDYTPRTANPNPVRP